jgi:DNA-binding NtrC family response regulator
MAEKEQKQSSGSVEAPTGLTTEARQAVKNLRVILEEFEQQIILETLNQNKGHRGKTAAMLGIDRKTLYMKLKKYGVS